MGNLPNCCNGKSQLQNIQEQQYISTKKNQDINISKKPTQTNLLTQKEDRKRDWKKNVEFPVVDQKILDLVQEKRIRYPGLRGYGQSGKQGIVGFGCEEVVAVYKGELTDGVLGGKARVAFGDGSYFQGLFDQNYPIQGIYVFPNASAYYVGNMQNFQASGKGYFQHITSGYSYQGSWQKNLPHGKGTQKLQNGDIYTGNFNHGSKFGQGKYQFKNGNIYEGYFYNDYIDGLGKLQMANGDTYEGEWKLGKMHGRGTYKWKNGEKYVGEYRDGERQGQGIYYYQNNVRYVGTWKQGLQNGEGSILMGYDQVKNRWDMGVRIQD